MYIYTHSIYVYMYTPTYTHTHTHIFCVCYMNLCCNLIFPYSGECAAISRTNNVCGLIKITYEGTPYTVRVLV